MSRNIAQPCKFPFSLRLYLYDLLPELSDDDEEAESSLYGNAKGGKRSSTAKILTKLAVSRRDFETACIPLLERISTATERVLDDYVQVVKERDNVDAVDRIGSIDEVILIGGATRMPMIRRLLERIFPD